VITYKRGEVYRSRTGQAYRVDENGSLRRLEGPKLSKAERKKAKRMRRLGGASR